LNNKTTEESVEPAFLAHLVESEESYSSSAPQASQAVTTEPDLTSF